MYFFSDTYHARGLQFPAQYVPGEARLMLGLTDRALKMLKSELFEVTLGWRLARRELLLLSNTSSHRTHCIGHY